MIAVLGPFIVRHPDVKGSMEQFMVQHVLPEFTAQEAYLRSVVCRPYSSLSLRVDTIQACEVLGVVTKAGITWSSEEVRIFTVK